MAGFYMSNCFDGDLTYFKPSVAFHIETSHLFCKAKQMAGFYMKRNAGLKLVKYVEKGINSFIHFLVCM